MQTRAVGMYTPVLTVSQAAHIRMRRFRIHVHVHVHTHAYMCTPLIAGLGHEHSSMQVPVSRSRMLMF